MRIGRVLVTNARYYGHLGVVPVGPDVPIGSRPKISSLSASVLLPQVCEKGSISSPVSGRGEIRSLPDYQAVVLLMSSRKAISLPSTTC
jgi:hypothetical protein